MKVRVKGLVFVGFAAAVFAQNAMATGDNDARTVTSKLYVDQKIEGATGNGGTIPYATTIDENSPNDKAPSSQNVYKFVKAQVGTVGVIGDNTYTKAGVVASGANQGKFQVELQQAPMTAGTGITGTLTDDSTSGGVTTPGTKKALVTAQAVKDLFDSTIDSSDDGKLLATSKAVYDYAQPKALNSSTYAGKFQVGYRASGSDAATWKVLQEDDTANVTHYVKMAQKATTGDNANVYNVNLDSNTIASSNSAISTAGGGSATAAEQAKLTTAKAVYDFVTTYGGNTYQPKVASNESSAPTATTMYIGKYVPANGATPASETWDRFVTDGYVTTDTTTAGTYKIKLDDNKIAATSDITSATSSNTSGGKLATAWSVKGLLDDATESSGVYTTSISSSSLNTVYPSSRNVYEYVKSQTGGNVIPTMSAECLEAITSSTPNNHCALVASWINGAIALEWTVIAQP